MGVASEWGQPMPQVAASDASGLITPQRMREIVLKTSTAGAAMNSVLDYAGGVPIGLRNVDAAKPLPKAQAAKIRKMLNRPNPTQSRRQFLLALMRDVFTLGFGAVEIEYDTGDYRTGKPVGLWVMDAARLRIDFDEHGTILGYDMLDARGMPIIDEHTLPKDGVRFDQGFPHGPNMGAMSTDPNAPGPHGWEPEEVILFSLNPMSESVYPYSRVSQLFTAAVIEDMMMFFISQRFTDSNIPYGVMDLGDVTEQELKIAIANWNAQADQSHHILLTGSKGSKWFPFGYHLKDLEATQLLGEVRMKIMGILGVTMNELGESQDINKSNGYNLSFTFKKRAIEPLLNEIVETLTARLLWDTFGYDDLEFYYDEIDSRDDLVQSQIDDSYLKMGVLTINDVRNRKGLPNIPGGEVNSVFTGSAWVPVDMITDLAEMMLKVEEAAAMTNPSAAMTGPDSTSAVREHISSPNSPSQNPSPSNKTQGKPAGTKPEGKVHAARSVTGSKKNE
jgi:hypothetical protein